jgi:hypothetical protein
MARSEKKNSKHHQIFIVGFQCVAKNIKKSLKMCALYLNYSQIWLNLLRDDRHFFLHIFMDVSHFGSQQKILK